MIKQDLSPERHEVAEISAATLSGVDGFMLTHETSVGTNPLQACLFMTKAIGEAEAVFDHEQ